jgi:hypothetical protein
MPTPPWHGHLLRGITEVSRKLNAAERDGYLPLPARRLTRKHVPCQNSHGFGAAWFQHFTALWISRTLKIGSIYALMGKILPVCG